jgi:hypothetical protein
VRLYQPTILSGVSQFVVHAMTICRQVLKLGVSNCCVLVAVAFMDALSDAFFERVAGDEAELRQWLKDVKKMKDDEIARKPKK